MRIFGIRDRVRAFARDVLEAPALRAQVDQLNTQLAGVTIAAIGWSKGQEAKQGQYGWSPAYQDVLVLRRAWEALHERYGSPQDVEISGDTAVLRQVRCGFCGGAVVTMSGPNDKVVLRAGDGILRVVSDLRRDTSIVDVRLLREPDGVLLVRSTHQCSGIQRL